MAKELPPYKLRVRELRDAVERLMDGDEPETLFIGRVRPAPRLDRSIGVGDFPEHASIDFHKPVRRAHRLATADGRTSFHFSHRTVVRLCSGSFYDGVLLRPGAARDHCRYVERESAVAGIAVDPTSPASSLIADRPDSLQAHMETDDDLRPYIHHPALAGDTAIVGRRLYSADLYLAEARSAADGLRPLPGFDVADAGGQAAGLLHGAAGGKLERAIGDRDGGLRGPANRPGPMAQASGEGSRGRGVRSAAAGHFAYVERDAAVAIQPDGTAAIITNIAASADARLKFWEQVEQEESAPGPDRMTIDTARDPAFWNRVVLDDGCPADLREALESPDPADRQKFIVSSGRDVRAFLSTVPGWEGRRGRKDGETSRDYRESGAGLATFHDGRGGRVQYRIIGELPSELSMAGKMRVLRRFGQRFEELNMPYNLALHAPDHGNSEHQWHFHLDYYDRPCWLLTQEEVDAARSRGYQPVGDGVGEWSFAAEFRRNGKVSRPFRFEKVEERRAPDWIERLRERLAFVTNEELKREGQYPRFDPRSYDRMGIKAEPGEHLGTKLSAAEGKGRVSDRSVANEAKQWAAIGRQLDDRRAAGNREVGAATAARERRLGALDLSATERAFLASRIAELDALERSILDIDHETATAQQLTARACSRASKIQQVNERWLYADEAGKCDLAPRVRRERESLRAAAEHYLEQLEPLRGAAVDIISVCDGARATALAQKHALERVIEARLADAEASAARLPAWLAQLDRRRPLILETRDGYRLPGAGEDAAIAAGEAGQRALKARHARQEGEVDALIATLERERLGLERRGGRWIFHHRDAAVVARFDVLREHPRIGPAIDRIMSPDGVRAPIARPVERRMHPVPGPASMPRPGSHLPSQGAITERSVVAAPPAAPTPAAPGTRWPSAPPAVAASDATTVTGPPGGETPPTIAATPVADRDNADVAGPPVIDSGAPPRDGRIDATAAALRGASVDRPAAAQSAPARGPIDTVPIAPAPASSSPAAGIYSVQRIIAEKIVLRVGLDGQIDARALAAKGIRIAEADRRDPRLVGKAREQQRHARGVVEHFVTKHPGFIVKTGDVCALSARVKPDVRAFFENHDDPWMQVMLRRVFDRHKAAEDSAVTTEVQVPPPSMTTLERDQAMIAAARARQHEREQAAVATLHGVADKPGGDGAANERDRQTGSPPPPTPGPRRPPPGWDGGFGR